jgi:hypothetical protein
MSRLRGTGPQPVKQQLMPWRSNTGSQVSIATNPTLTTPTLATSAVPASITPEPTATVTVQANTGLIIAQWPVFGTQYVRQRGSYYSDGITHEQRHPGGQPTTLHQCSLAVSHQIHITNIPLGWEPYTTIDDDDLVITLHRFEMSELPDRKWDREGQRPGWGI